MELNFYAETEEEKEYAAFRAQQHYRKIEHMNKLYLQFLTEMILCDKIQIKDMPFEIRTLDRGFYVAAFRVSRNISSKRFADDLQLLQKDLEKDFPKKERFQRILDLYIQWDLPAGDENNEAFQKEKGNNSRTNRR